MIMTLIHNLFICSADALYGLRLGLTPCLRIRQWIQVVDMIKVSDRSRCSSRRIEVACLPCGIRETFEEEDEAIAHAYSHEKVHTHIVLQVDILWM
jgi:hypothetical protein